MFKKSLVFGVAVLLTAVLFIFAGCEGPAGPIGQTGNDGSDVPFPGDITVTIPGGNNVPTLPAGVTYPPLTGAKILSGNSADISKAFNGGILVANTPDSGLGDDFVAGTNGGTVYAQDAVDYVVWTGPGSDLPGTPANQGSIVVPPGKTLFIAAPLIISTPANGTFESITVSDKGAFAPEVSASIQAAVGGTTISPDAPEGKIVLLNGGSIRGIDTASTIDEMNITIGGTLEIHHGAYISVGSANFLSTARSAVNVYGRITGNNTANVHPMQFDGTLTIKGGGLVSGTNQAAFADVFNGPVVVESYGALRLGGPGLSYPTVFKGPVTVAEEGEFSLQGSGANPVVFNNEAVISGALNAGGDTVTLDDLVTTLHTGRLRITATGEISASQWLNINTGTDTSLLAAIVPGAQPSDTNHYTTIEVPSGVSVEPLVFTFVNPLTITSYQNLVDLAASPVLSLPGRIKATWVSIGATPLLAFNPAVPLVVKTNDVDLEGYETVGDITVEKDAALVVTGAGVITSAGTITVLGGFDPGDATFAAKLDKLEIGGASENETVATTVTIPMATFTTAEGPITVNAGSTLILGHTAGTDPDVNPAGPISLAAGADLTVLGAGATLARLGTLEIAAGASFTAANAIATFEKLEVLQVTGEFTAAVDNGAGTLFNTLQKIKADGTDDVKGAGKAVFSNWTVDNTSHGHAFDQLLGIADLTVASLDNVTNTKGNGSDITPDAFIPADADNPILRVSGAVRINGNLTVDRDLNILSIAPGTIVFDNNETLTISPGRKVVAGTAAAGFTPSGLSVSSANPAAILKSGGTSGALLTAGIVDGTGTLALTLDTLSVEPGTATPPATARPIVLNVDGRLAAGTAGTADILAGLGDGLITLGGVGTYLQNGTIESGVLDTDVNAKIVVNGTLNIAGDSSVTGNSTAGSSITLGNRGRLVSPVPAGVLSFFSGANGITFAGTHPSAVDIPAILVGGSTTGTIAAGTTDGDAVITGDLFAYGGEAVLTTTGTGGTLSIGTSTGGGSLTVGYGGNGYESLKLSGSNTNFAEITGFFVFNAEQDHATLTLGANNAPSSLEGGTLTTTGATAKLSILDGASGAVEVASFTASGSQSFANIIVEGDGTNAQLTGSLNLSAGTTLNVAIGKTFEVVLDSGPSANSSLSVAGGGAIRLPGTAKITLAAINSAFYGSLTLNTTAGNTIAGLGTGLSGGSNLTAVGASGVAGTTYNSPNLTIAGAGGTGGTSGTNTAIAELANGVITITGQGTGSTLNSSGSIIRLL